jgi:hypothetical protein
MADGQDFINPQALPPALIVGNGHTPRPVGDTAPAAEPQDLAQQNVFQQNLLTITGQLGPLSASQFMTLSGNACKLYAYISSAEGVVIPFQQDKLSFGVGLQDIRTVLRVLKELWQHECIRVHFDETTVDHPLGLFVKGRKVVLKTEREFITINRIYVRCVPFPEQIPPQVAIALDTRLKRQIQATEERISALKQAKAQWEQRSRRQQQPGDTQKSAALAVTQGLTEERNGESPL